MLMTQKMRYQEDNMNHIELARLHLRTYGISTEADYDAVIDKLRAGTL